MMLRLGLKGFTTLSISFKKQSLIIFLDWYLLESLLKKNIDFLSTDDYGMFLSFSTSNLLIYGLYNQLLVDKGIGVLNRNYINGKYSSENYMMIIDFATKVDEPRLWHTALKLYVLV